MHRDCPPRFSLPASGLRSWTRPVRREPPKWTHRTDRALSLASCASAIRPRGPGFPGHPLQTGAHAPSCLGSCARDACLSPKGGTSRPGRLAPYRPTSKLVASWVGRNRTQLMQDHRSRVTRRHLPVREATQLFLVRSRSQLGSAWELPRARSEGLRRPAPATYSIHFSKTTAHASSHSGPRMPHWARGLPLLRWDVHFGGLGEPTRSLFDPGQPPNRASAPSSQTP